jgi:cytochrome c oxidase cbb3-type subunit III
MNEDPGKDPLLLPHDADGIRELDNNLPRWWVWLFYLTTLFAAGYMLVYHVFELAPLSAGEYKIEHDKGEALKSASQAKFEASLDSLEPSKDEAILARGKKTFLTYCAPCHRPDGGGLVGPNLTDDYWIHGPRFQDNLKVIINGVPDKGMLTWKGVLQPAEIHAVASYIFTLRGTRPPNPKPPENQAPAAPTESFE